MLGASARRMAVLVRREDLSHYSKLDSTATLRLSKRRLRESKAVGLKSQRTPCETVIVGGVNARTNVTAGFKKQRTHLVPETRVWSSWIPGEVVELVAVEDRDAPAKLEPDGAEDVRGIEIPRDLRASGRRAPDLPRPQWLGDLSSRRPRGRLGSGELIVLESAVAHEVEALEGGACLLTLARAS